MSDYYSLYSPAVSCFHVDLPLQKLFSVRMVTEAEEHRFKAHVLKIVQVTVFEDRAEIKRTVHVSLKPGISRIILEVTIQLSLSI